MFLLKAVILLGLWPFLLWGQVHIKPISDYIGITVTGFNNTKIDAITYEHLQAEPTPSVLIDLRNNTGGHLHEALKFSALFVTANHLIDLQRSSNTDGVTRPQSHPYIATKRLIILVNQQTASAAEASAFVLSKHPKATIIGMPTFGKTSITSQQNAAKHTQFILPNQQILPHIQHTFDSTTDLQSQHLNAIQLVSD